MKICCELCGGSLRMNAGGKDAVCVNCAMTYPVDRLREMLNRQAHTLVQNTPQPPVQNPPQPLVKNGGQDGYLAPQFVMQVTSGGKGVANGLVQQGGIGIGDQVFINNDFQHPYTVQGNEGGEPVHQGDRQLWLLNCPEQVLNNARIITGVPNPWQNAYNFPGDVYGFFDYLLRREFSDYQIHANVPCNGLKMPASFMLSRDGKPVVTVFLISPYDNSERYQAAKAVRILTPYAIGSTHFFTNYRNDAPYVIQRIRRAMPN